MSKINKHSAKYCNLQSKLSELGLYEKGMEIDEMQKIEVAVNESILDQDDNIDFENSNGEFFTHNSTMISFAGNSNTVESGFMSHESCSIHASPPSPINSSRKFVVVAQVHHELNYSPEIAKNEQNTKNIMNNQKSEKYNSETNNSIIIIDDVDEHMENHIIDSGLFLEPENPINASKNLDTFFKNVRLLK